MNPFEQPPTTPPVSLDPPSAGGVPDGPRRGRMALAALAAAGLVGGGLVAVSQFASADRPTLETAAAIDEPGDEPVDEPLDAPDDGADDAPDDGADDERVPSIDGQIVIDDGDGEPTVIDLGELGLGEMDLGELDLGELDLGELDLGELDLGALLGEVGSCFDGPMFGDGPLGGLFGDHLDDGVMDDSFHERMEQFLDDLPWDELGDLNVDDDGVRIFGSGGSTVTVVGPDGVEIIDLGDGDATVTIEQSDGDLTVTTDGDATVAELPDFSELMPRPGEMKRLLPFDPDHMERFESCLDDLADE